MKTIDRNSNRFTFQGDVMIERVTCPVPKTAKEDLAAVVAHSETGHHHVAERAQVFNCDDGFTIYMRALGKNVDIVHKRSYDTHETLRFDTEPGDVFRIKRQREYTPEGWRRVED